MLGDMSFDEHHLRMENARLKELAEWPMLPESPSLLPPLDLEMGAYSTHFHELPPQQAVLCGEMLLPSGLVDEDSALAGTMIMEGKKQIALELAMMASNQLLRMCRLNEQLWLRSGCKGASDSQMEVMNEDVHRITFPWPMVVKPLGGMEGTRDSALVIMNSITLVDAFMDSNKWMDLFPSIVSKANTIQIVTPGLLGNGSGALHLMYAEIHVLSPLVPTREAYFLRFCQKKEEEGSWIIVDFPMDNLQEGGQMTSMRYRRWPSGCVIQDMANGYSRVTWVEHAEVEDKPVHQIFTQFICSKMGFGATRWVSILQQQCERLAHFRDMNISVLDGFPIEAMRSIMKLSHKMVKTFCSSITSNGTQSWTALSDLPDDTLRVTTRKNTLPGQPNGVILSAVSTTRLPFTSDEVFNLLADERQRTQLDALSIGNSLLKMAEVAYGDNFRNLITLQFINAASNSSQNVEFLLQESCTHSSGSRLIVYASIGKDSVQATLSGEDPSHIFLLPTGFALFPAGPQASTSNANNIASDGCLLTVGMQVLASADPSAKLNLSSVTSLNHQLCSAVHQISSALEGEFCAALLNLDQ